MVIERFRDRDPLPIYRRLRDSGRMLPEGLTYLESWVEPNFDRCFQLMECDDLRLIQQWVLNGHGADVTIDRAGGSKQGHRGGGWAPPG